jgi:transposase-like protein
MSEFKWRHFEGEIILWAVRWYCRYGVSYRDLEQMMGERGVPVDHSTIYHWVQRYAPEIEKRLRWQWRRPRSTSWRVYETYVRVRGKWTCLYRALDKEETRSIFIYRQLGMPMGTASFTRWVNVSEAKTNWRSIHLV